MTDHRASGEPRGGLVLRYVETGGPWGSPCRQARAAPVGAQVNGSKPLKSSTCLSVVQNLLICDMFSSIMIRVLIMYLGELYRSVGELLR